MIIGPASLSSVVMQKKNMPTAGQAQQSCFGERQSRDNKKRGRIIHCRGDFPSIEGSFGGGLPSASSGIQDPQVSKHNKSIHANRRPALTFLIPSCGRTLDSLPVCVPSGGR